MSDSYPYLALSRRLGTDYGAVLDYVDSLDSCVLTKYDHRLTIEQKEAVVEERRLEIVRRRQRNWSPCDQCTDPMDCGSWATCERGRV